MENIWNLGPEPNLPSSYSKKRLHKMEKALEKFKMFYLRLDSIAQILNKYCSQTVTIYRIIASGKEKRPAV